MSRKVRIPLILLLVATAGLLCVFAVATLLWHFRLREACHLEYRGGVRFSSTCGEEYKIASWHAEDWTDPGPCPFTVHLPGEDLDPAHLGAIDRLKDEGWTVYDWGGEEVELYTRERLVRCWFRDKRLTHVEVNVVSVGGREIPPVSITVFGKTVAMPASEATIVTALGPPSRKHSP